MFKNLFSHNIILYHLGNHYIDNSDEAKEIRKDVKDIEKSIKGIDQEIKQLDKEKKKLLKTLQNLDKEVIQHRIL